MVILSAMRELRLLRTLAVFVAGLSCLVMPVMVSSLCALDPHQGEEHAAHGSSEVEACWTVEVSHHTPHDDLRFELQEGPDYHLHSAVGWAGAFSVQAPGLAVHAAAPSHEAPAWVRSHDAPSSLDRSTRQSRAPPRA